MKHLNVKWGAETKATISLRAAMYNNGVSSRVTVQVLRLGCGAPCVRHIVISGDAKLKADVTAVERAAA